MADKLIAKITLSDEQMEEIRDIKRQIEKLDDFETFVADMRGE